MNVKKNLLITIMLATSVNNTYCFRLDFLRNFNPLGNFDVSHFMLPFHSLSPSGLMRAIPGAITAVPFGNEIVSTVTAGGVAIALMPLGINPWFILFCGTGAYSAIQRYSLNRKIDRLDGKVTEGFEQNKKEFNTAAARAEKHHQETTQELYEIKETQLQTNQTLHNVELGQQQMQLQLATVAQQTTEAKDITKDLTAKFKSFVVKATDNFEKQEKQIENLQTTVGRNHQENQEKFIAIQQGVERIEYKISEQDKKMGQLLDKQQESEDLALAFKLQVQEEFKEQSKKMEKQAEVNTKRHESIEENFVDLKSSLSQLVTIGMQRVQNIVNLPSKPLVHSVHVAVAATMLSANKTDGQTDLPANDDLD